MLRDFLAQLAFQLFDQLIAFGLDFILPVKQVTPLLGALCLKITLFLLGLELVGERCGAFALGSGFLDLPVKFLDLAFKTYLQVVGPGIEFFGFL